MPSSQIQAPDSSLALAVPGPADERLVVDRAVSK